MAPRNCVKGRPPRWCGTHTELTENDQRQMDLFKRFLNGERSHEIVAWALGEPQSSANDPDMVGMGC